VLVLPHLGVGARDIVKGEDLAHAGVDAALDDQLLPTRLCGVRDETSTPIVAGVS
jgi:hypothetical protein